MNKKSYMEPTCEVVTLNIETQLLAGSVMEVQSDVVTLDSDDNPIWAD